jgi:hypothetical protein
MNIQKLREILSLYKQHFPEINQQEIYKWRVVRHFQETWNIEAVDFFSMLDASLSTSRNLLASGNYFARRMLVLNAKLYPDEIRQLFIELYDEEEDLVTRVSNFKASFTEVNERTFPGRNPYQDDRAILVYLSLRYPNSYYLYKYTMFRDFVGLVSHPYLPTRGDVENVPQYLKICSLVKDEILRDEELLTLNRSRIGAAEYSDSSYHILTQDVIYAATFHLPAAQVAAELQPASVRLIRVNLTITPGFNDVALRGSTTNFANLEREKKKIGDLGELLVYQWEKERVSRLGGEHSPRHDSISKGDGLGYDILSYDENGEEIFIEVKTTKGSANRPFFITGNELERSKRDADKFILYRLYDFDDENMTAKFFERKGDLTELCNNPVLFKTVF